MDLILVRHGLPQTSRMTSDPPLSEIGRAQARRVALHLAEEAVDAVWASTMRRAIETAEPLTCSAGLELQTHAGVCEYDKTRSHYIPDEVLKAEDYEAWKAAVATDLAMDMTPFQEEVVEGLEHIIGRHPGGRVVVFCHGGVINVWTAHVLKMAPRLFFSPDYGSVSRFACARNGARTIISLNEHAHMRDIGHGRSTTNTDE